MSECNHKIDIAKHGEYKGIYYCTRCTLIVTPERVSGLFKYIRSLKGEIALADNDEKFLKAKLEEANKAIREIYEVWAGSDAIKPITISGKYQAGLIEKMRDIAGEYLKGDE